MLPYHGCIIHQVLVYTMEGWDTNTELEYWGGHASFLPSRYSLSELPGFCHFSLLPVYVCLTNGIWHKLLCVKDSSCTLFLSRLPLKLCQNQSSDSSLGLFYSYTVIMMFYWQYSELPLWLYNCIYGENAVIVMWKSLIPRLFQYWGRNAKDRCNLRQFSIGW